MHELSKRLVNKGLLGFTDDGLVELAIGPF